MDTILKSLKLAKDGIYSAEIPTSEQEVELKMRSEVASKEYSDYFKEPFNSDDGSGNKTILKEDKTEWSRLGYRRLLGLALEESFQRKAGCKGDCRGFSKGKFKACKEVFRGFNRKERLSYPCGRYFFAVPRSGF